VSAGTIVATAGGGLVITGGHRSEAKGSYPVAVRVRDVGGSSAGALATATVTGKS